MDKMHETLRDFAKHYTDYIPEIPVLDHIPSAIEFLSDYVLLNKPFIISCPENHLPAVERWQEYFYLETLTVRADRKVVTVNVTPYYRRDQIPYGRYMCPEIRSKDCYDFLFANEFENRATDDYYYVMKDNNLEEFPQWAHDIRTEVPFATEALDSAPLDVNLSIVDMDPVPPMRKDEHDNFFDVIKGWRQFKLIPPIAHFCIPYKKYKKFQWKFNEGKNKWDQVDLNEEIEVISTEIEAETLEKNGFFRNIKSYNVTINPGESLYIPYLWYYEYQQSRHCYTLNYSYEWKKWDLKFPLLRFLSKLFKVKKPSMTNDVSVGIQDELEGALYEDIDDSRRPPWQKY